MQDAVAVTVSGVSKNFVLPQEKVSSIKGLFTGLYKKSAAPKNVHYALDAVDFSVRKGEFFGIVGRNGSGKSTLLKILASIYQPSAGSVTVDGRLVPFIELGVGFNPELTGRENVYLNGAMLGFSEQEVTVMYDDIVKFAELEKFMDQKLKNYSSGMQVRLAFSMATRSQADILLVDEVLAVGDADFQRKCFRYFKSLKKNDKTVIFVSHDMNAVREYCDRAILIQDGKILTEGNAEVVSQAYLRLFNEQAVDDDGENYEEDNRWGNRWVSLQSTRCDVTSQSLTITCAVTASRDVEGVVQGFRVRSNDGAELLGTNATILKQPLLHLRAGESCTITWQVPNIFSKGEYYVDPSLILRDGATVCDWWNEAATFTIEKEHSTSYPVTPDIRLTVRDKGTTPDA